MIARFQEKKKAHFLLHLLRAPSNHLSDYWKHKSVKQPGEKMTLQLKKTKKQPVINILFFNLTDYNTETTISQAGASHLNFRCFFSE